MSEREDDRGELTETKGADVDRVMDRLLGGKREGMRRISGQEGRTGWREEGEGERKTTIKKQSKLSMSRIEQQCY